MNKIQSIVLFVGLIWFGWAGLFSNIDQRAVSRDIAQLLVYWFTIAVVTAGAIYLLKDPPKKSDGEQD